MLELYLLLAIFAIPLGYVVVKFIQSMSPKGFARGLANAQLRSLGVLRSKDPDKPNEELYEAALMMRPGYTLEKVANIIDGARTACEESGVMFNFQAVVASLAAAEYLRRTGNSPLPVMNEMNEAVCSVIPWEL